LMRGRYTPNQHRVQFKNAAMSLSLIKTNDNIEWAKRDNAAHAAIRLMEDFMKWIKKHPAGLEILTSQFDSNLSWSPMKDDLCHIDTFLNQCFGLRMLIWDGDLFDGDENVYGNFLHPYPVTNKLFYPPMKIIDDSISKRECRYTADNVIDLFKCGGEKFNHVDLIRHGQLAKLWRGPPADDVKIANHNRTFFCYGCFRMGGSNHVCGDVSKIVNRIQRPAAEPMKPRDGIKDRPIPTMLIADMECICNTLNDNQTTWENIPHRPCVIPVNVVTFSDSMDADGNWLCSEPKIESFIYKDDYVEKDGVWECQRNCMEKFFNDIPKLLHKSGIVIFHNGSGYDNFFLVESAIRQNHGIKNNSIRMYDNRLKALRILDRRIVDSYLHFNISLADLVHTYKLETGPKGCIPY